MDCTKSWASDASAIVDIPFGLLGFHNINDFKPAVPPRGKAQNAGVL
jgi:hypothetical protein